MIATQIHCVLLPKGMTIQSEAEDAAGLHVNLAKLQGTFDHELDEALVIYVRSLDKCLKSDDESLPIDDLGMLTEDIFLISGITDIGLNISYDAEWLREYMANSDWEDLKQEAAPIYDVALAHIAIWREKENRRPRSADLPIAVSFIGCWHVSTSRGFEDTYDDIDSIDFLGEGRVVQIQ